MRLSSVQIFQQGINAILNQQSRLQQTELQLASGKRVLTPSDDPVAAVQILSLGESLAAVDQYQSNATLAEAQLSFEESVLSDAGNLLQRVRELVIQANNATQTAETRRAIGVEIDAQLDALMALANTQDGNGEYIFAGFQSDAIPFIRQGNGVVYTGDEGQRFVQLAAGSQIAVRDSGAEVFQDIPAGNGRFVVETSGVNTGSAVAGRTSADNSFVPDTYTIVFSQPTPTDPISYQVLDSTAAVVASGTYSDGDTISFSGADVEISGIPADGDSFVVSPAGKQDVFTTLQEIVTALGGSGNAGASSVTELHNVLGQGLTDLDQALGHFLEIRADIGVRLNQVENQRNINESFTLQLQQTLSDTEDLDYAEAISRFNLQLTALQAAQQSYARAQGLSLFNFL